MPRRAAVKKGSPVAMRDSDEELDALLVEHTPEVVDPGYDGHMLRVAGIPWAEVARRIGSPTPVAAVRAVSSYLQKAAAAQSAQQQQEALQTQLDRYEAILAAWWARATSGQDEKAAGIVLKTLQLMDRVLRLDDSDIILTKETLVISANPELYIKQLQDVVAERKAVTK